VTNQYGALSLSTISADSNYTGLKLKLEKRFSYGLQFLASYAWAHEIDLGSGCFACSASPQDIRSPSADRGPGAFDMRHIFTVSYSYDLPFGRRQRFLGRESGVTNQLVAGWQLTGITRFNIGIPLNVLLGFMLTMALPGRSNGRIWSDTRESCPAMTKHKAGWILPRTPSRPVHLWQP
jgi:hypothetical protein